MAGGLRYNEGKLPMELIDPIALEGLAAVLQRGAKKYAPYNWAKGMSWQTVIGCLLRHTFQFMKGEDIDKESGCPHVDHIFCNAMFLANYFRRQKDLDDRFKQCDSKEQEQAKQPVKEVVCIPAGYVPVIMSDGTILGWKTPN